MQPIFGKGSLQGSYATTGWATRGGFAMGGKSAPHMQTADEAGLSLSKCTKAAAFWDSRPIEL